MTGCGKIVAGQDGTKPSMISHSCSNSLADEQLAPKETETFYVYFLHFISVLSVCFLGLIEFYAFMLLCEFRKFRANKFLCLSGYFCRDKTYTFSFLYEF